MKNLSPYSHTDVIHALLSLPSWQYDEEMQRIYTRWRFKDYAAACSFVMYVSLLAEQRNHHPDIHFGWGYAEIFLTTHDAKGVTDRDITLATAINRYAGLMKN
jgi:4a-hydroxytetrahydrobiopterin dehydratase